MKSIVLINGNKQSRLLVMNRNTQFGDGVFETILYKDRFLYFWDDHFKRLEKGRKTLEIRPIKESVLLKDIKKATAQLDKGSYAIKIILSRGKTERGYGYSQDIKPDRVIIISKISSITKDKFDLSVCQSGYFSNPQLSKIKHCNRLQEVLARRSLESDECLMLDENGDVISTSQGNIFLVKNKILYTPIIEKSGIEGTTRAQIISCAHELNIKVSIKNIIPDEVYKSDEIFMTNSIVGMKKFNSFKDKSFTNSPVFDQLELKYLSLGEEKKIFIAKSLVPKFKVYGFFVGIFLLIFAWFYYAKDLNVYSNQIYRIDNGTSLSQLIKDLNQKSITRSNVMSYLVSTLYRNQSVKAGYYEVLESDNIFDLFSKFYQGKVATVDLTLIPGQSIHNFFADLTTLDSVEGKMNLKEVMSNLNALYPYEGWFWPETYQFNYGVSRLDVMKRFHQKMLKELNTRWSKRDKKIPLENPYEAIVLASLIEMESSKQEERKIIAGVFYNRLNANMRLQTDPTVIYAMGDKYTGKLTRENLKIDSPYNTYKYKGLPPGAISTVSASSLNAALHPMTTDAYYFVSKKDGSHAFSKTYKEHQKNIDKYLK